MPSTILSDNGVSSGSAGLKTTASNDGILVLQTTTSGGTATNAVYVDTSQNVGLGATPELKLTVNGAVNIRNSSRAGAFEIDSSGNLWTGTATTAGNIYLETGHSTTGLPSTGTARVTVNQYGLGLSATPSSGTGITFPATQSASSDANTLDDYEEGTWTPTLTGATFTYSVQAGRYLKIGSFVLVQAVIATGYASATGPFYISNLPFTVVNDSNVRGGVATVNCQYGVTFNNYVTGEPINNSTNMYFENNYSGNNRADMGSSYFASGGFAVRVNMTYQVA